jgi:hypothetical protein
MMNGKKREKEKKKEKEKRKERTREIARFARHDTPFLRGKRSGSEINLKRD